MVQASDECQHKDQSSWLKALTFWSIDGVTEYNNYCVEQKNIRQVSCDSWKDLVNYDAEYTQGHVIVNTNIGIVKSDWNNEAKYSKQQSGNDEYYHLSLHIDNLSIVLVFLVFCFLVQIIQLKSPSVDCSTA